MKASLAEFAGPRGLGRGLEDAGKASLAAAVEAGPERASSVLLLRVLATADYHTNDAVAMTKPALVSVDIILDPFVLNVMPRSLVPTVGYILALVPIAWLTAGWISTWTQSLAIKMRDEGESKKVR
jgi:hypothetical protein